MDQGACHNRTFNRCNRLQSDAYVTIQMFKLAHVARRSLA